MFKKFLKFTKKDKKEKKAKSQFEFIIGDCGSGKTAYAVVQAYKYLKKGYPVFSNMQIEGCYRYSIEDLMKYDFPPYSVFIFDESATYGLASRGTTYKDSNKKNVIEFFTMYRHYKVEKIIIISPSFADVIPIVRSRTKNITVCKPTLLNCLGFGKTKLVGKKIDVVQEGGGEPKEVFSWIPFSTRYHYRRHIFNKYDTYSTTNKLEPKKFMKWN